MADPVLTIVENTPSRLAIEWDRRDGSKVFLAVCVLAATVAMAVACALAAPNNAEIAVAVAIWAVIVALLVNAWRSRERIEVSESELRFGLAMTEWIATRDVIGMDVVEVDTTYRGRTTRQWRIDARCQSAQIRTIAKFGNPRVAWDMHGRLAHRLGLAAAPRTDGPVDLPRAIARERADLPVAIAREKDKETEPE